MALSERQERFVEEYLVDLSALNAALRAGYSPHTAGRQGSRLLKRDDIKRAVIEARAQRSERTKIDADWLLTRLADEAEADVADILGPDGAVKPVDQWPPIWRKGLVQGFDIEEVRRDGAVVAHVRKVKISDRVKRLELIGRHIDVGAFRDRVEHTGKDGGPIQSEDVTPLREVARRLAFLLASGAKEMDDD